MELLEKKRRFRSLIDFDRHDLVWPKIDKSQIGTGCWLWTGASMGGYGIMGVCINGVRHGVVAHRLVYTICKGEIPDPLVLDHLCRNTLCVNPDHLEPVSNKENTLRSPHKNMQSYRAGTCVKGHKIEGENAYAYFDKPTGKNKVRCFQCLCRNYVKKPKVERVKKPKPVGPGVARGEAAGKSIFTESLVKQIRSEYGWFSTEGKLNAYELARKYSCSYGAIYKILKRITWKHIP
jgi:HNH endonuclease